jgi:hypothetical protein
MYETKVGRKRLAIDWLVIKFEKERFEAPPTPP